MSSLDKIDLNHLRILAALLDTQSVTRAALQLGISQPSVSRALGALRKAFGDPLLVKTNTGMVLTQRAEELCQPLDRWASATRRVLRSPGIDGRSDISGRIRVASTDFGVLSVIAPAMARISREAPHLCVDVSMLDPENLNQLSSGAVDAVISGFDPVPGRVHERHLFNNSWRCLFRKGHPLAASEGSGPVSMDDLYEWPHILLSLNSSDIDPLSRHMDEGRVRKVAMRVPYIMSAPHILQSTDAILIAPERAVDDLSKVCELASRPVPVDLGTFEYWILWHERSRRDPVVMWFVDAISASLEKNLPS